MELQITQNIKVLFWKGLLSVSLYHFTDNKPFYLFLKTQNIDLGFNVV